MARDIGLSRALSKLDQSPVWLAVSIGALSGAVVGFVCLDGMSVVGIAAFIALVAGSALFVVFTRPVVVPARRGSAADERRNTAAGVDERLKTAAGVAEKRPSA